MTEDMRRALDDIRALLMEQFRRETDAAFAALELEMERAARQGGSGGYRGSSDTQSLAREE